MVHNVAHYTETRSKEGAHILLFNAEFIEEKGQISCQRVPQYREYVLYLLHPFQIIGRLTFLTSSLTTRLIQKICANIVKFKLLLKNLY